MSASNVWRSILGALALAMLSGCAFGPLADDVDTVETEPGHPAAPVTAEQGGEGVSPAGEARSALTSTPPNVVPPPSGPREATGPYPEPWTRTSD